MGYPPVPNFDMTLIAETARIVSKTNPNLKSTTGEIIAHEPAYRTGKNYFLISARIKGGNSGGPVIGKHGRVVGIVTQYCVSTDSSDPIPDTLGFGVVIPVETLRTVIDYCKEDSDQVEKVKFEPFNGGFRLL